MDNRCFIKYCIPLIFFGMIAFMIMLANFKPDFMKENFASFVDMINFKKETEVVKESYIKKDDRYIEPSVFESSDQ